MSGDKGERDSDSARKPSGGTRGREGNLAGSQGPPDRGQGGQKDRAPTGSERQQGAGKRPKQASHGDSPKGREPGTGRGEGSARGAGRSGERPPLPRRGTEGYSAPYKSQPRNVTIGGERTIKEHIIPGAQLEEITRDPTTGRSDYQRKTEKGRPGRDYRRNTTVLVPERKANDKTYSSGKTPSDLRRIADVKRKQEAAALGRGPGANLNRDLVEPSVKRSVEAGIKPKHAARGALHQLGELFGLQRLDETAKKLQGFEERLRILGGVLGGRSGERPPIRSGGSERRTPIRSGGSEGPARPPEEAATTSKLAKPATTPEVERPPLAPRGKPGTVGVAGAGDDQGRPATPLVATPEAPRDRTPTPTAGTPHGAEVRMPNVPVEVRAGLGARLRSLSRGAAVGALGIGAGLLESWVRGKMVDDGIKSGYKEMGPEIDKRLKALGPQVAARRAESPDKPLYAHITVRESVMQSINEAAGEVYWAPDLGEAKLLSVTISTEKIDPPRERADHEQHFGYYWDHTVITYSVPLLPK